MHFMDRRPVTASCSGELTVQEYLDYIGLSDYMSKRRTFKGLLVGAAIYGFAIIPALLAIGAPPAPVLVLAILVFVPLVAFVVAMVQQRPVWWWTEYQVTWLFRQYSESLGYPLDDRPKRFRFELRGDAVRFVTCSKELVAPLDEVRWVRQSGDLVIVGCLSGAKSFVSPIFSREVQHYKAVPAAAFLKTKLEGMDPDELIALLEECAKKPKPPNLQASIRELPYSMIRSGMCPF